MTGTNGLPPRQKARQVYQPDKKSKATPQRAPAPLPDPVKRRVSVELKAYEWVHVLRWLGPLEEGQVPTSVLRLMQEASKALRNQE